MNHAATLAQLGRYMLRASHWGADAEAWSKTLPSDSPAWNAAWLRNEVMRGRASVAALVSDGAEVGFVVYQATPDREFVVMAAWGRDGSNLTEVIDDLASQLARSLGCTVFRVHTMRAGLIDKLIGRGFRVSETILRKDLA